MPELSRGGGGDPTATTPDPTTEVGDVTGNPAGAGLSDGGGASDDEADSDDEFDDVGGGDPAGAGLSDGGGTSGDTGSTSPTSDAPEPESTDSIRDRIGGTVGDVGERVTDVREGVGETIDGARERVDQGVGRVNTVREDVGETAGNVADRGRSVVDTVGSGADRVRDAGATIDERRQDVADEITSIGQRDTPPEQDFESDTPRGELESQLESTYDTDLTRDDIDVDREGDMLTGELSEEGRETVAAENAPLADTPLLGDLTQTGARLRQDELQATRPAARAFEDATPDESDVFGALDGATPFDIPAADNVDSDGRGAALGGLAVGAAGAGSGAGATGAGLGAGSVGAAGAATIGGAVTVAAGLGAVGSGFASGRVNPAEAETLAPGAQSELDVGGNVFGGAEVDAPQQPTTGGEIDAPSDPDLGSEVDTPDDPTMGGGEFGVPEEPANTDAGVGVFNTAPIQQPVGREGARDTAETGSEVDDGGVQIGGDDIETGVPEPDQPGPSIREQQRRGGLFPPRRDFPTGEDAVIGRETGSDLADEVGNTDVTVDGQLDVVDPGLGTGTGTGTGQIPLPPGPGNEPDTDQPAATTPVTDQPPATEPIIDVFGTQQPATETATVSAQASPAFANPNPLATEATAPLPAASAFGGDSPARNQRPRLPSGGDREPAPEATPPQRAPQTTPFRNPIAGSVDSLFGASNPGLGQGDQGSSDGRERREREGLFGVF